MRGGIASASWPLAAVLVILVAATALVRLAAAATTAAALAVVRARLTLASTMGVVVALRVGVAMSAAAAATATPTGVTAVVMTAMVVVGGVVPVVGTLSAVPVAVVFATAAVVVVVMTTCMCPVVVEILDRALSVPLIRGGAGERVGLVVVEEVFALVKVSLVPRHGMVVPVLALILPKVLSIQGQEVGHIVGMRTLSTNGARRGGA